MARVERGPAPAYTVITAQGRQAVLLNIQSQPDGSTLDIAAALKAKLQQLRQELPPDMHLSFFYDQSQFVRDSVGSVWDAIIFGLILSVLILYFFLKNWGSVLDGHRHHSHHRAHHVRRHETGEHEFQHDDARRHRGVHRPDH